MSQKEVVVQITGGLEARPVAVLVQVASRYDSVIHLEAGDRRVNAKSIMGMMTLSLNVGEKLIIEADGQDEKAAIAGLEQYITGNGTPS
jgi:catabolite repression HPr-like protein